MTTLSSVQDAWLARAAAAPELQWFAPDGTPDDDAPPGPRVSSSLRVDGTLAPLTYRHARDLAWRLGARLPFRAEALAFGQLPHVPYQTLPHDSPAFGTVEGAREVSRRLDRLHARSLATELVDNESKYWIDGATPGWSFLLGFFDDAGVPVQKGTGRPGQPGYGPRGEPHNDLHVDYSSAPRFVIQPHEVKLQELAELARKQGGTPDRTAMREMFRRATRRPEMGGGASGWAPGWDWCAAGACYLASERGVGLGIHGYRITVWELIADAREAGRFVDIGGTNASRDRFLASGWQPKVGDLVCFSRKGDPRRAGETGHVETVVSPCDAAGYYGTVSGNSPGWRAKSRALSDATCVGFIER